MKATKPPQLMYNLKYIKNIYLDNKNHDKQNTSYPKANAAK